MNLLSNTAAQTALGYRPKDVPSFRSRLLEECQGDQDPERLFQRIREIIGERAEEREGWGDEVRKVVIAVALSNPAQADLWLETVNMPIYGTLEQYPTYHVDDAICVIVGSLDAVLELDKSDRGLESPAHYVYPMLLERIIVTQFSPMYGDDSTPRTATRLWQKDPFFQRCQEFANGLKAYIKGPTYNMIDSYRRLEGMNAMALRLCAKFRLNQTETRSSGFGYGLVEYFSYGLLSSSSQWEKLHAAVQATPNPPIVLPKSYVIG